MSSTIEDRVILLLNEKSESQITRHGFWSNLEARTGISSKRWRKVYGREQRITSDMLQSLAQQFPLHAFWLTTGITDAVNGHIAPITAQTFPERLYVESDCSNTYFRECLELSDALFEKSGLNSSNDNERLNAYQRDKAFAHWWDSPLCETAYKIAKSEEYKQLDEIRKSRELERNKAIDFITKPDERPWIKKRIENVGLTLDPVYGADPRTQHQDGWDLYYKPI